MKVEFAIKEVLYHYFEIEEVHEGFLELEIDERHDFLMQRAYDGAMETYQDCEVYEVVDYTVYEEQPVVIPLETPINCVIIAADDPDYAWS